MHHYAFVVRGDNTQLRTEETNDMFRWDAPKCVIKISTKKVHRHSPTDNQIMYRAY